MDKGYEVTNQEGHVTCTLSLETVKDVCSCGLSVDGHTGIWNITSWYTKEGFRHKGYGQAVMQQALWFCLGQYGTPSGIQYTWNGANAYVLEWLEKNFSAVCICPVAVLKTQPGDSWDAHIYDLDKDKVMDYFGLKYL